MPTRTRQDSGAAAAATAVMTKSDIKKVVVIGNGPSAITLSYLLAGNVPYYSGVAEDPYLHKRLSQSRDKPLVLQSLEDLATGCEGRSSNPVSVFFDYLNHPGADTGIERESLLDWRKRPDLQIDDHIIIGKGKPGGCWETLEGNVQTVSLGNWMELPNLKMSQALDGCEEGAPTDARVKVASVAKYYQEYVRKMELERYFLNHSVVTSVREITELSCPAAAKSQPPMRDIQSVPDLTRDCDEDAIFRIDSFLDNPLPEFPESLDIDICRCSSSSSSSTEGGESLASSPIGVAFQNGGGSSNAETPSSSQNGSRGEEAASSSSTRRSAMNIHNRQRSRCLRDRCSYFGAECCASDGDLEEFAMSSSCSWNPIVNPELFCSLGTCDGSLPRSRAHTWSDELASSCERQRQQQCAVSTCFPDTERLFEVTGFTTVPGGGPSRSFRYLTKSVVLATGSYDVPNRLDIHGENLPFVLHSLTELEDVISRGLLSRNSDPVLVVGAGLSSADAIVTLQEEGITVAHAFRRTVDDPSLIFKVLPKALYPEYHRVFNFMKGDLKSEGYVPMAEHHIMDIRPSKRVVLHLGDLKKTISVSYVIIMIGSSPDLDFMEEKLRGNLGIMKSEPISRSNPVDIDVFSNEAVDVPGIYAMGPLIGDNFVRFVQGGALAIAADVLKKEKKAVPEN